VPHVPFRWLTTNAWYLPLEPASYLPPALQFPAAGHDTEKISEKLDAFRFVLLTSTAFPHLPFRWLTTNACRRREASL